MYYIYVCIYVYNIKKFHVNVCYLLQPVHNELTLCVQCNSIFFQAVSVRCSGPTLQIGLTEK